MSLCWCWFYCFQDPHPQQYPSCIHTKPHLCILKKYLHDSSTLYYAEVTSGMWAFPWVFVAFPAKSYHSKYTPHLWCSDPPYLGKSLSLSQVLLITTVSTSLLTSWDMHAHSSSEGGIGRETCRTGSKTPKRTIGQTSPKWGNSEVLSN